MTVKSVPHEIAQPSVANIYPRATASPAAALSGALAAKAPVEVTGTHTGTLTGVTTTVTATFRYVKAGSIVVLYVPEMTGTSNSTAATITGMPVGIRPARTQLLVGRVQDNGAFVLGGLQIGTDGAITLGSGALFGAFSALLAKGCPAQTLCYSLV